MKFLARYRKTFVALAGVGVYIIGQQFGVNSHVYADVVEVLLALGVYVVPNEPAPAKTAPPA